VGDKRSDGQGTELLKERLRVFAYPLANIGKELLHVLPIRIANDFGKARSDKTKKTPFSSLNHEQNQTS